MTSSLTDTLNTIENQTHGKTISFGDLAKALNSLGFGALLIGPALITVLPTGAIPGIPSLCAIFIILVCVQILLGRDYPWMPKKLKNITFSRLQFLKGLRKILPYTKNIDTVFYPRLTFLTHNTAQAMIACLCVVLACLMITFEIIPFAAFLPALAILVLGLGISAHDGILILFGLLIAAAACSIIPLVLVHI